MKDILDAVYLWSYKKLLTPWIMKYEILSSKHDYYVIPGISNNRYIKSYLYNRKKNVSINGFDFGLTEVKCRVPQGYALRPLLFFLYIHDLDEATKFCKVHHCADYTNLIYLDKFIKKLNKVVNFHLINMVYQLNARKILLNAKKVKLVIFKFKGKQFDGKIKLKLSRNSFFAN